MDMHHAHAVMREAECLHSADEVAAAFQRMAAAVSERLQAADPLVFAVMNGGLIAAGQILPLLDFPLQFAYLHATRYGGATQGGELNWLVKPQQSLQGRTVLVIDDILDEGHTLAAILDYCRDQGAVDVLTAVAVNKQHQRKARPEFRADFVGLEVADRFLFGCGMDYKGYWRNTLAIYAVKGL